MTIHVTSRRVTTNGGLAREATVLRNDFTSVLKLVEYARRRLDRANRNDILKTQQTLSYIYKYTIAANSFFMFFSLELFITDATSTWELRRKVIPVSVEFLETGKTAVSLR